MTLIPIKWKEITRGKYDPDTKVFHRDVDDDHIMRKHDVSLGMNTELIDILEAMGCVFVHAHIGPNSLKPVGVYEIELQVYRKDGIPGKYTEGPQLFVPLSRFRRVA